MWLFLEQVNSNESYVASVNQHLHLIIYNNQCWLAVISGGM